MRPFARWSEYLESSGVAREKEEDGIRNERKQEWYRALFREATIQLLNYQCGFFLSSASPSNGGDVFDNTVTIPKSL